MARNETPQILDPDRLPPDIDLDVNIKEETAEVTLTLNALSVPERVERLRRGRSEFHILEEEEIKEKISKAWEAIREGHFLSSKIMKALHEKEFDVIQKDDDGKTRVGRITTLLMDGKSYAVQPDEFHPAEGKFNLQDLETDLLKKMSEMTFDDEKKQLKVKITANRSPNSHQFTIKLIDEWKKLLTGRGFYSENPDIPIFELDDWKAFTRHLTENASFLDPAQVLNELQNNLYFILEALTYTREKEELLKSVNVDVWGGIKKYEHVSDLLKEGILDNFTHPGVGSETSQTVIKPGADSDSTTAGSTPQSPGSSRGSSESFHLPASMPPLLSRNPDGRRRVGINPEKKSTPIETKNRQKGQTRGGASKPGWQR